MKICKTTNELYALIAKDVGQSLLAATRSEEAKKLVVQGIDEGLGPAGTTPDSYRRRGSNGGLTDPNLVVTTVSQKKVSPAGFSIDFLIKNIAEGNADWRGGVNPAKKGGQPFYVGAIVQTGVGYSWENSRYYTGENCMFGKPIPRDIYGKAGEKLTENDNLTSLTAKELKKRGW